MYDLVNDIDRRFIRYFNGSYYCHYVSE